MIKKIWKDNFEMLVKEGAEVISKEDIDDVIDILVSDKIDPRVFIYNLEVLIQGHLSLLNFSGIENKKPSPSVCRFDIPVSIFPIAYRILAIPLWFYAAYPDVMKWFHNYKEEYEKSPNFDVYGTMEIMKLFGAKEADIEKDKMFNKEKQWKPEYLKNLVKNYIEKTGNNLEVMVEEFSESDIYTGQEMLEAFGTESNFTLIAEITTKFYLELEKNYKSFFADQTSLLATAGILDAQWYVFSDKIKPSEILNIAKEAVKSKDLLLNFIIELEVKLLGIDTPHMTEDAIRKACKEQKESIKNAIQKTEKEYSGEPRIISDTNMFINSDKFNHIKKDLGVKKGVKSIFFSTPILITGFIVAVLVGRLAGVLGILIVSGFAILGIWFSFWYLDKPKRKLSVIKIISWISLVAWLIPIVGLSVSLATLVFGEQLKARKYLILGFIGLALSIFWGILGVYLESI